MERLFINKTQFIITEKLQQTEKLVHYKQLNKVCKLIFLIYHIHLTVC